MIPRDWERNEHPGEGEGKLLMKILPRRKRWKTGNMLLDAQSGQAVYYMWASRICTAHFIRPEKPVSFTQPLFIQPASDSELCLTQIMLHVFCWSSSPELSDALLPMQPSDVLDMPVDPNEPTYCLCHQVSYGEMIGCDNPDVGFHNFSLLLKFKLIHFCIMTACNHYFASLFLFSVSNWVVSLRLCWSRHKTQRKMVRPLLGS